MIEVALAVGILAIMGTLTWGAIARSWDAYETVTTIDARYHNVRTAMNRMARDLSMAFLAPPQRGVTDEDDQWQTIFKAEESSPLSEIHFTAFAHDILQQDAKESDQSEIAYFGEVDEDDSSKVNLMRREDPRLDGEPEKGGRAYILAEDIKELKFRFFDAKDDDWTDEWDTEKSDFRNRMPTIVEIRMIIEDENKEELEFVTKTRIFMPYLLNF